MGGVIFVHWATEVAPSFSQVVGVIFPILTIIAGGIAILAYGSNKVLRDTSADLRQRVADLEKDREADRALIAAQTAELKVWQGAVTGEVHLTAILNLLTQHHNEAVAEWQKVDAILERCGDALEVIARSQ